MIIKPKNWIEFHRFKYLIQGLEGIDNRSSQVTQKRFGYLTEIIDFRPDDIVLDFGCGSAYLYLLIKDRIKEYLGVDSCSEVVKCLSKKYPQAGFYTEIPNKQFTKIIANSVLMYLENEAELIRILKNFYERLSSGGLLFVGEMPTENEYRSKKRSLFKRLKMLLSSRRYLQTLPSTLYYQPNDFLQLCRGLGFKGNFSKSHFLDVKRFDYILRK